MAQLARDDGVEIHWEERGHRSAGRPRPLLHLAIPRSSTRSGPSSPRPPRRPLRRPWHRRVDAPGTVRHGDRHGGPRGRDRGRRLGRRRGRAGRRGQPRGPRCGEQARPGPSRGRARRQPRRTKRARGHRRDGLLRAGRGGLPQHGARPITEGALRSLTTAGNPQMSEDEIRERVRLQAEYQPQEAAVSPPARLGRRRRQRVRTAVRRRGCGSSFPMTRAAGGSRPARRAAGSRASSSPTPTSSEIENGIISRPDLTAAAVRRVTSELRVKSGA